MTRLVLVLVALVALAGCGKRGNPEPPGPASAISYPKIYPTH
jgi:predicted small lipoprotein YifL